MEAISALQEVVSYLSFEIVLGCDAFTKEDIHQFINDNDLDKDEIRRLVDIDIRATYPEHECWSPAFIEASLNSWLS